MKAISFSALALLAVMLHGRNAAQIEIRGMAANPTAAEISIAGEPVPLARDGSFAFSGRIDKPRFLPIVCQGRRFTVFVVPGERLAISFDARDIDRTIAFAGTGAALDRFLLQQGRIDAEVRAYLAPTTPEWRELFRRPMALFRRSVAAMKNRYIHALAALVRAERDVHPDFVRLTRLRTTFLFDRLLYEYPQWHPLFTGRPAALGRKTLAELRSIRLDDPDLPEIDGYADFGRLALLQRIRDDVPLDSQRGRAGNLLLQRAFTVIARTFRHMEMIDFWRLHFLLDYIERHGIGAVEPFVERFQADCRDAGQRARLTALLDKERRNRSGHRVETYKSVGGYHLAAHVFPPAGLREGERRPAVVYLHGGSWSEGKPDWDFGTSPIGFVNICIEYRTHERFGVTPYAAIADVKSAIRWVRRNAAALQVDENRIVAEGASAGGHLALCAALLDTLDEADEDRTVGSRPNALVLNAAVYDVFHSWYGQSEPDMRRVAAISPVHHIRRIPIPMLIFHGTADTDSAPYADCLRFVSAMQTAGTPVTFHPLPDIGHALWTAPGFWDLSQSAHRAFFHHLGYLQPGTD